MFLPMLAFLLGRPGSPLANNTNELDAILEDLARGDRIKIEVGKQGDLISLIVE
jgi:hypothetical protein